MRGCGRDDVSSQLQLFHETSIRRGPISVFSLYREVNKTRGNPWYLFISAKKLIAEHLLMGLTASTKSRAISEARKALANCRVSRGATTK